MLEPLFDFQPKLDKRIVSIVSILLSKLKNNNPKQDSKCYLRVANFVNELYTGNFIKNKRFDNSKDKLFDMDGVFDKVNSVQGDWIKVRNLINDCLSHLEEAKKPEKMPWNKKFIEDISFAKFFNNGYTPLGEIDCPFLHFVNPPKDSYSYNSDITINKLKNNTLSLIKAPAEKFCKKYFKMKNYQLSFWYDMEDWTRWLKLFKSVFPSIYGEFVNCCKNGNPFDDFTDYLLFVLKQKEGEHPVMNHWYFRLTYNDNTELDGYFKQWLRAGIDKGRFNILKQLPRSIDSYYTEESFSKSKIKSEKKKVIIDVEELPIF